MQKRTHGCRIKMMLEHTGVELRSVYIYIHTQLLCQLVFLRFLSVYIYISGCNDATTCGDCDSDANL